MKYDKEQHERVTSTAKESLREVFQKLVSNCEHPRCPECGEIEISHGHFDGNAAVPETDFLICTNCGHQWGFE